MEESRALTLIDLFDFQGKKFRYILDGENNPWWPIADVCQNLGILDVRQSANRLDEDETRIYPIDTPRGLQQMTCVNESGVYHLIFSSHKPEAKAFRRKFTSEIIPTIRKTGVYDPQGQIPALHLQLQESVQREQDIMEVLMQVLNDQVELGGKILNPGNEMLQEADLGDWVRVFLRMEDRFREMYQAKKITAAEKTLFLQAVQAARKVSEKHLAHWEKYEPMTEGLWEKAYFGNQKAIKMLRTMQKQQDILKESYQLLSGGTLPTQLLEMEQAHVREIERRVLEDIQMNQFVPHDPERVATVANIVRSLNGSLDVSEEQVLQAIAALQKAGEIREMQTGDVIWYYPVQQGE